MAIAKQPVAPPLRMSFEEFLDWGDEDTWAEWIDGEVITLMPASTVHQLLMGFLMRVLSEFVEERGLGLLFTPPYVMRLASVRRGREPDLLFVAAEHQDRLRKNHLDGPADLVVEIISPDSAKRDRHDKLAEYELGGVREYWILDPDKRQAVFYQLDGSGRYHEASVDVSGIYRSEVLDGFWLEVLWLWQSPFPTLAAVRAAWATKASEQLT